MEISLEDSHEGYRLLVRDLLANKRTCRLKVKTRNSSKKKNIHTQTIENTLLRNEAEHLNVESCK